MIHFELISLVSSDDEYPRAQQLFVTNADEQDYNPCFLNQESVQMLLKLERSYCPNSVQSQRTLNISFWAY